MSRRTPKEIIIRYALVLLTLLTGVYLLFGIGLDKVIEWVKPFSDWLLG